MALSWNLPRDDPNYISYTGVQKNPASIDGGPIAITPSSQTQHLGQNQVPGFTQLGATPPKTGKTSTGKQIWYGAPMQVGDYMSLMQQNSQGSSTTGVTANPFGTVGTGVVRADGTTAGSQGGKDVAADWAADWRRRGINSWADYLTQNQMFGNIVI